MGGLGAILERLWAGLGRKLAVLDGQDQSCDKCNCHSANLGAVLGGLGAIWAYVGRCWAALGGHNVGILIEKRGKTW